MKHKDLLSQHTDIASPTAISSRRHWCICRSRYC